MVRQIGFQVLKIYYRRMVLCSKLFLLEFKQRLIDSFVQSWHADIVNSPVLLLYKDIKNVFQYEKYLDLLPSSLRHYISRIRLSAHPLLIQSGRYGSNRIPRNERFCIYCSLHDIEDEYHFFSNIICDVADPLFKHVYNNKHMFNIDMKWFNSECVNAKQLYKQTLYDFNCNKSYENLTLYECKKHVNISFAKLSVPLFGNSHRS
jgi:hypothetical protein